MVLIKSIQMDKPSDIQMDPSTLAQQFINNWIQKNKEFVLSVPSRPSRSPEMEKRKELLDAAQVIKETYVIIHIVSVSPYPDMSTLELSSLFNEITAIFEGISAGNQAPAMADIMKLHDKVVKFVQVGGDHYTQLVYQTIEPLSVTLNVPTGPDNEPLSADEMIEMMEEQQAFISQPIPFTAEEQQQLTSILSDFVAEKLDMEDDDATYDYVSKAINESYQLCEIASWWKNHSLMLQSFANEMMLAKMDLSKMDLE